MEKRRKKTQRALYRFLRENAEIEKQSRDEELIAGSWTIKLGARAFRARKKRKDPETGIWKTTIQNDVWIIHQVFKQIDKTKLK